MPRRRAQTQRLAADTAIGIGVDRLDYTKGILERFLAVERFLELEPEWIGKFVFVQIAAPSRSSIDEYQNYDARVRALARRINDKFSNKRHEPILLKIEHTTRTTSTSTTGIGAVFREQPARRHEPRRQGVRGLARRRARVLVLSQFTGRRESCPKP